MPRARSPRILRSRRVVVDHGIRPAAVHVEDGAIAAVGAWDEVPAGADLVDHGDLLLMPGLVDTHVHVNEPGRTEWEGFATATRAAAAGGVTTIVDMPLNSVPATTTVAAFREKRAATAGKLTVDVGFWGGVVPGNAAELAPLHASGVLGFKCFLVPSGVDDFAAVGEAELRTALPVLAALDTTLLVHAELPGPIDAALAALGGAPRNHYATWLASRPRAAEDEAIALLVALARATGAHVHVVHVSSSGALPLLRAAREEGLRITVETCPHYLALAAEEIRDGATDHKCAPPIRERANNERLWEALRDGLVDLIASDHSPCPPALKERGDFFRAWGGIASLELGLPVVWTAARERGFAPERLAAWMAAAPAALAGLGRKGRIAPGLDADLVAWDPDASFRVDPARLRQRHPVTPYAGRELRGVVAATYLRGRAVFDRGVVPGPPHGQLVLRAGSHPAGAESL